MAGYKNCEDSQQQQGQQVWISRCAIRRLQPEHATEFIYLTCHRSRNSISLACFQVIFRESRISIGDGIVRVGGMQLFHAERLPTLLVQAAPIDAHLANYLNQAFLRACRADARSNFHVPSLCPRSGQACFQRLGSNEYAWFQQLFVRPGLTC